MGAIQSDYKIYTEEEVWNDYSHGLYYYTEIQCTYCNKRSGRYMTEFILGKVSSMCFPCSDCKKSITSDHQIDLTKGWDDF